MTRTEVFTLKFVGGMPLSSKTKTGVLYISYKHKSTLHKCPCGCGLDVYLPTTRFLSKLRYQQWDLKVGGDVATLSPSISIRIGCRSHYYIKNNRVRWV